MNKIMLVGRLTRDADVKAIGERQVVEFGVATSEKMKDKEEVIFHNVSLWGTNMDNFAKYLTKGKAVEVDGKQVNKDKFSNVLAYRVSFCPTNTKKDEEIMPF